MKRNLRKLLMLAIAALLSIGGSAEARSTLRTPDESPMDPSSAAAAAAYDVSSWLTEDVVPEGQYYIRNSEAGTFLAGANDWGTRLSLKSAGDKIELTRKAGSNSYVFRDVSVRGGNTGKEIGDPKNGDLQLWLDQSSPASGYKFHKLTEAEIKAIDDECGSEFSNGVGKDYYFIYYVDYNGNTVFLTKDKPGVSNHSQVSGMDINGDEAPSIKNFVWELFTDEKLAQDLYDNATRDFFLSATPFLDNPDFSRNLNSTTDNNGWTVETGKGLSGIGGNNYNFIAYSENKTFSLYQTLTGVPNGEYGIIAYAIYDGAPSGSDATVPYFYVQDASKKQVKTFIHVDTKYDAGTWSSTSYFASSDEEILQKYRLDTIYVSVWDNTLTVGFAGGGQGMSAYFDNVQLLYFGMTKDIATLTQRYSTVSKQGKAILTANKPMGAEYKQALQTAVNNIPDFSDPKSIADAIVGIQKAMSAANASISLYGDIVSKYDAEVSKLGAEAQEFYNEKIRKPIVEAGVLQNENQLLVGLNAAKIYDRGKNADVTDIIIVNPSFETGDLTGWTANSLYDTGSKENSNGTYTMSGCDGRYLFNTWNWDAGSPVYQTLKGLAPGTYTLTAIMATDGDKWLHLNVGEDNEAVVASDSNGKGTGVNISVDFTVDNISEMVIYAWASANKESKLSGSDQWWYKADNFHLIYNGPKDLTVLRDELTAELGNATALLKKKMNYDVEFALRTAQYNAEHVNQNDEEALTQAIANLKSNNKAAQTSVSVYDNINAVIEKGNKLDASGKAAFNDYVATIQTKWTNGQITDGTEELSNVQNIYVKAIKEQTTQGAVMTEAVSNWECTSGYVKNQFTWNDKVNAIVKDWKIYDEKDVEITYDGNHPISEYFHVNTWSNEAETGADGNTPMTNPFAEFWTDAGTNYLGQHHIKIAHTVERGYKPGRYKLGIMARLYTVDANASSITGYKFIANGLESKSRFEKSTNGVFYAWDEIDFFVDDKGEIEFYFDINYGNFYWLAFKMLKLSYEGQTYSSEQAEQMIAEATAKFGGEIMNKDVEANFKSSMDAFRDNPSIVNGQAFLLAEQAVQASIKLYEDVMNDVVTYQEAAENYNNKKGFDELGRTKFEELMGQIEDAINNRTIAAGDEDIVKNAYHSALTAQKTGNFTELIENPGFETGDLTGWTTDTGTDVGVKPVHNLNGEDPNATYTTWVDGCDEGNAPLYNKLFNTWTSENGERGTMIKQTIKNIPNGKYRVSAYLATYGNYYAFVFGNDTHSDPTNNTGYSNDLDGAKKHAVKAEVEVKVSNGQLTIGAVGGVAENGSVPGNLFPENYPKVKGGWYKADAFTLEYLGAIDNKDLYATLMQTCEYADLYKDKPMNKDTLALLMNAYNAAKACDETSRNDVLSKLNDEIVEYTKRTFNSIKIYEDINVFLEKAKTLDDAGYKKFQKEVGYIIDAYKNGDITDGKAEMDALEDILRIATKAQVDEHTDWTGAIYNPSFENKGLHWGAQSGYKSLDAIKASNMPWSHAVGERYAYRLNEGESPVQINYYQNIDTVAIGIYKLKATVYTNSKTVSIYGNDLKTVISPCTSTDEVREVEQIIVSWNGKRITLGIIGTLKKGEQIRVDNFRLEYISSDLDIEEEKVPDDVQINKEIRNQQNYAVEQFRDEQQPAYLAAAIDAIAAAKESAEYYQKAKFYLDSCYKYMEKSNVYSEAAWNYCTNMLKEYQADWDAGKLDNKDIKNMLYAIFQNGFTGFNDVVAQDISIYKSDFPILYYIFDAWTLVKEDSSWETIKADGSFHINTWSKEVTDQTVSETTSKMTTPFIEYWRKPSDGPLEDATIHAKAINLEPGLYTMKVLTRVTNESGTNPADLQGISMRVSTDRVRENNGRTSYDTESVDICKGDIRQDSHLGVVSQEFKIDSIIVRAKDNHDAHVYFDVKNTNANWLAWKYCQFVRVRDLTFYEEDDPASDEDIAKLWELIRRDEKKAIGFNVSEYSPYTNRDAIKVHNAARKYLEANYKEEGYNHCTKYQVNEYIKALYEDPDHPELSKWQMQNEDVNGVYNANFSLVHPSLYTDLPGWKIYDTSVPQPKTGGMSASCATASAEWAQFDNAKGSINLDGEENTFSTAAMFKFPNDKTSLRYCSTKSVYTYGDSAGFEMPLDPDQTYVFSCNFGYYTEGQNGSIRIEVRNAKTNELVQDASKVYSPNVCISDSTKLPDMLRFTFHTPKASSKNYKNTLENFDNLETYKIVLRNANPDQVWTMVVSNIKLYRWPNAIMEIKPGAHYGTFIAPFDAKIPEGVTAFVITGKEDTAHPYVNPSTGETFYFTTIKKTQNWSNIVYQGKNGTIATRKGDFTDYNTGERPIIPAHVPVVIFTSNPEGYYGIASGEDYDDRQGEAREYRPDPTSDDVYLEGWEGEYDEKERQMKEKTADNGWYVLSMKRADMWACFYVVDENASAKAVRPSIPANRCYLVDPTYNSSNPGRIRKFLFDFDEALDMTTSIENSDNQNHEVEIIGIYSLDGTPQKTFKPGVNIIKMSDGTTRKKFIQ